MAASLTVQQRLEALEASVDLLQHQVTKRPVENNWLDRISGILANEPDFEKVCRFGRMIRADMERDSYDA